MLIASLLRVNLPKPLEQPSASTVQVLVAFRYFATGSFYITNGDTLLVSESSQEELCVWISRAEANFVSVVNQQVGQIWCY